MKRMAKTEKGSITSKQAIDRVRAIAHQETGTKIPDAALHFYAEEYIDMVREARKA